MKIVSYISRNKFVTWIIDSKKQAVNTKLNLTVAYITKQIVSTPTDIGTMFSLFIFILLLSSHL